MYFTLYIMINKKRVTITLDIVTYKKFREECNNEDVKMSTKINTLINNWLNSRSMK